MQYLYILCACTKYNCFLYHNQKKETKSIFVGKLCVELLLSFFASFLSDENDITSSNLISRYFTFLFSMSVIFICHTKIIEKASHGDLFNKHNTFHHIIFMFRTQEFLFGWCRHVTFFNKKNYDFIHNANTFKNSLHYVKNNFT